MLMVTQLKDFSLITNVLCIMVPDLKDLSVQLGKHLDSVMLLVQNAQLINQKEDGVLLNDSIPSLPNQLLMDNLSVFLLEDGQTLLIPHTQLNKLLHQPLMLLPLLTVLIMLVVEQQSFKLLISIGNIYLMIPIQLELELKKSQLMLKLLLKLEQLYQK